MFRVLISEYNTSANKAQYLDIGFLQGICKTCFICLCDRLHGSINKNKITLFMSLSSNVECF